MASGKGLFISALGGMVLRQAVVRKVSTVSARFRWLELGDDRLRGVDWIPGDKVQLLLPSLDMRTYTPLGWDKQTGTTELLVYRRESGADPAREDPGIRWSGAVRPGDPCRFVGPQRSIAVAPETPIVLFGDETSFAVALALGRAATAPCGWVFEVNARQEATAVLAELGLRDAVCVERAADDSHLEGIAGELNALLSRRPDARLIMTGRAQAIQALQSRRRAAREARPFKTKAYWSLGKAGLD